MEKNKALARAMDYCARSERSGREIRALLESIGTESGDIEEIVDQLQKEGFLDELRYARSFVNDKYRFYSWGRKKISYQLSAKGIPSDIILEALETLDPDDYYENLKDQLEKKLSSIKGGNYYEKKAKLMRFAAGRGYEPDIVYDAIDEILKG